MGKNGNHKLRGKVKWFSDEKGFGFIEREGLADTFVHYTGIDGEGHRTLEKGQTVDFYIEDSRHTGRPNATMVTVVAAE